MSPKKPNSANRRITKVKTIKNPSFLTVKLPGEKHNLQQHFTILVCGGRSKDLIGVRIKAVRGSKLSTTLLFLGGKNPAVYTALKYFRN